MKKNILVFILSVSSLFAAAQDPGKLIKDQWTNITAQLSHKAELAMNVVSIAEGYKSVDRDMFNKTKAFALVLNKSLQLNNAPDSVSIEIIRKRNDGLSLSLDKLIQQLDSDNKFKNSIELGNYESHLKLLEEKLSSAITSYNSAVDKAGRADLYYKLLKK